MNPRLQLTLGQYSAAGRKAVNQDAHGACLPGARLLGSKGAALAIADGVSTSSVGHVASAVAVQAFLSDYYDTPETWSVRRSAQRVVAATNAWLSAQNSGLGDDRDLGHVCTFSALVLKSVTAHLFHVGDARIHRLAGGVLEQLTEDHRLHVSGGRSYLARALGVAGQVEIDYRSLPVEAGDLFLLSTDGVHEYLSRTDMRVIIGSHGEDLQAAARALVEAALARGSDDNLTVQLLRVDVLPQPRVDELVSRLAALPLPAALEAGRMLDELRLLRCLHTGSRSHVYLAEDMSSGRHLVVKVPSQDLAHDRAALARFLTEEWIACRVSNPHVQGGVDLATARRHLYTVSEFVPGQTLRRWMREHPAPALDVVRDIVDQIARGLQALHRLDILHQDLRPENIMIDEAGKVRLIDFGSARVAGLAEGQGALLVSDGLPLGALAYAAPEHFLGEGGSEHSDQFSLGVLTYELLSGGLPYGTAVAGARSRAEQSRLAYRPLSAEDREFPAWLDAVIRQEEHQLQQRRH
ncbi:MAG: bifunctional protein-serine/threonine kinase/phosphatase, partial [Perlucidibaca sp.]